MSSEEYMDGFMHGVLPGGGVLFEGVGSRQMCPNDFIKGMEAGEVAREVAEKSSKKLDGWEFGDLCETLVKKGFVNRMAPLYAHMLITCKGNIRSYDVKGLWKNLEIPWERHTEKYWEEKSAKLKRVWNSR